PTAQLDWLKTLTNRTHVLHILVGNFDVYDFCHLNAQAARRMRDLPFPRSHVDHQRECEECVGALRSLRERGPLPADVPVQLAHWRWFGEWSLGCIGVLGDWRVETIDTLCQEGATTLTLEALTRHALQPDQRVRMAMEARPGEHQVERAKAQSAHELQQLLANPAPLPGSDTHTRGEAPGALERHALPDTTPRPRPRARIARAARRDPVGEQGSAVPTKKCPFAGVVESAPQRFLTSGITSVEGPDGAARRSLVLRNGVLRCPSQDQRKTRTPQTERRWARQDTRWEVVGG